MDSASSRLSYIPASESKEKPLWYPHRMLLSNLRKPGLEEHVLNQKNHMDICGVDVQRVWRCSRRLLTLHFLRQDSVSINFGGVVELVTVRCVEEKFQVDMLVWIGCVT